MDFFHSLPMFTRLSHFKVMYRTYPVSAQFNSGNNLYCYTTIKQNFYNANNLATNEPIVPIAQ